MKKLLLATIILSTLISGTASAANTDDFYFESFEADYYLTREEDGTGSLAVEEELIAVFPDYDQNHGIVRIIPTTNQDGKNFTMDPSIISIDTFRGGEEEPVADVVSNGLYHEVYLGHKSVYVHGVQDYDLVYDFKNVITEPLGSEEPQELYWDTNGTGFPQRFDSLIVRVHLDDDSYEAWTGDAWCYVGRHGSSDQSRCTWEETTTGTIEFAVIGSLAPYENLTYDLTFAPGTFTIPDPPTGSTLIALTALIGGISLIFIIGMLISYAQQRRRYLDWKSTPIAPEYQPLRDLTIAEACHLSTTARAHYSIAATLIELAIAGKVKFKEAKSKILNKPKWQVEIASIAGLSEPQLAALAIINGGDAVAQGDIVELGRHLSNSKITAAQNTYRESPEASLTAKQLMQKYPRIGMVVGPIVVYILAAFCIFFSSLTTVTETYGAIVTAPWLAAVIAGIAIAVSIWSFIIAGHTIKTAQRTDQGLRTERRIEGIKLFIKLAEKDRLAFLHSVKGAERIDTKDGKKVVKLYEKLLPYAIIFGLEKSWGKELEKYYQELGDTYIPAWYIGTHAFNSSTLTSQLHSITTSVSSSTSSGSSGGGSSGGGGGGGGGGGW